MASGDRWKPWDDGEVPDEVVEVVYYDSRVFPDGAVVQAHTEEIKSGVTGDPYPRFWREIQ
jgi:hypothetical protein